MPLNNVAVSLLFRYQCSQGILLCRHTLWMESRKIHTAPALVYLLIARRVWFSWLQRWLNHGKSRNASSRCNGFFLSC